MSQNEKLLERFKSKPKNFTYNELRNLLTNLGYQEDIAKEGSRVAFVHTVTQDMIRLHKPHPSNILKEYQIKQILNHLKEQNRI